MIKFQQSQALTSHFESFWSIVQLNSNPCILSMHPLLYSFWQNFFLNFVCPVIAPVTLHFRVVDPLMIGFVTLGNEWNFIFQTFVKCQRFGSCITTFVERKLELSNEEIFERLKNQKPLLRFFSKIAWCEA